MPAILTKIFRDQIDLLLFKPFRSKIGEFWPSYLLWGIFITWLVGIGRYWDHPNAELWQYLGFGSVLYVFILSFVLWGIAAPLKPRYWSYRNVLIFVTMTSLPALLYAIPVEQFMSLTSAQTANVWFLAIVAIWRVTLLLNFLRKVAQLSYSEVIVAGLLPLVLIVTSLVILNLEHAVFQIMGGIRNPTQFDAAYSVLFMLTTISLLLSPILLIWYGRLVYLKMKTPAN